MLWVTRRNNGKEKKGVDEFNKEGKKRREGDLKRKNKHREGEKEGKRDIRSREKGSGIESKGDLRRTREKGIGE